MYNAKNEASWHTFDLNFNVGFIEGKLDCGLSGFKNFCKTCQLGTLFDSSKDQRNFPFYRL
jgi:hypothetical protein